MSKRIRLTKRLAADGSIPYPGNVNQPGREDPEWAQYHTFQQQVNHELPDMRHEWKDDSRDDIGYGIPEANPPTVASVRVAANKAVRIAVLLLGEKVEDDVIEAQARDIMAMNQQAMDRTLSRFADTQKLYAEEDEEEKEEKEASEDDEEEKEEKEASVSVQASEELADKGSEVPAPISLEETEVTAEEEDDKEGCKKGEDEAEVEVEETVEARLARLESMIAGLGEKKEEKEEKEASEDEKEEKEEKEASEDEKEEKEEKEASEDEEEKEEKEASVTASPNEMDIELVSSMDEVESDPEADAQLASLYDDGPTASVEKQPVAKTAKVKKAGIKKLGGQPRVASDAGAGSVDPSSLWETAPDVSDVFR